MTHDTTVENALRMAMTTITAQDDDWEQIAKAQIEAAMDHAEAMVGQLRVARQFGTISDGALRLACDELEASYEALKKAEARVERQARHIEHLESMVREAYDDEGIIWRARRQYGGWPDAEGGDA